MIESTLEERLDARLSDDEKRGRPRSATGRRSGRRGVAPPADERVPTHPRRDPVHRDLPRAAAALLAAGGARRLVETEQAILIFRQRHARMVERIIGRRVGTGGSAASTTSTRRRSQYRVFRDLWAARTHLLPEGALPALDDPTYYDFAVRP